MEEPLNYKHFDRSRDPLHFCELKGVGLFYFAINHVTVQMHYISFSEEIFLVQWAIWARDIVSNHETLFYGGCHLERDQFKSYKK